MTMGRLAWEWMKRSRPPHGGSLRILRKAAVDSVGLSELRKKGVFLNDPETSEVFLAYWAPDSYCWERG
jgi:hypothetical protein